ncbi:MAG: transcription repressor NadR [Bacillota bacterium]
MSAQARRQAIVGMLSASPEPITGTELSERLGVSRQIVVQDIALLRASGAAILATPRGYLLSGPPSGAITHLVACRHHPDEVSDELLTMVERGAEVLDVIVEHPIYGEINGRLLLKTREDVEDFVRRMAASGARLLSSLTGGVHLHTLRVPDAATYRAVRSALQRRGYLLEED